MAFTNNIRKASVFNRCFDVIDARFIDKRIHEWYNDNEIIIIMRFCDMRIHSMCLGEMYTNTYVVSADEKSCVVIDPAGSDNGAYKVISKLGYTLDAVLLTHCHYDHISGLEELLSHYDGGSVPVYASEYEKEYFTDTSLNLSPMFGLSYVYTGDVAPLKDGDVIKAGGTEFKVLHTPGHTRGSVCYISSDVIFSGDTLFAGSIGRTDFKYGDISAMMSSLGRLKALKGEYTVYPGHDEPTTLEREKAYNAYMQ